MAMPEYTPAPAPSKAEFDSLASDVSTLNGNIQNKLVTYSDIEVTISEATTWVSVDLPSGVSSENVISAKVSSGTYRPLVFWKGTSASKIWILRLNTNGTDIYVDNSTGTFTVRIYYTV